MMVQKSSGTESVLWVGKPYILPDLVGRTALFIIIAIVAFWLEFAYGVAFQVFFSVPIILWTALVLLIAWLVSLSNLLLLKASNTYILRRDGLQVESGILRTKSFVVPPSGFSDLEVIRTLYSRLLNFGYIVIRTQGRREIRMVRVRDPRNVAEQIREVMARPTVRIDN
jgi:membrane protein YdbS with pleckstrin-like domain